MSLSEGGQRGEVVSGEGDEQWLSKWSQGPGSSAGELRVRRMGV